MSAEHGRVVTTEVFTSDDRAAGRRPWLASHPAPAQARRFGLADLLAFST